VITLQRGSTYVAACMCLPWLGQSGMTEWHGGWEQRNGRRRVISRHRSAMYCKFKSVDSESAKRWLCGEVDNSDPVDSVEAVKRNF